jgi:hypothetical protein
MIDATSAKLGLYRFMAIAERAAGFIAERAM